MQWTNWCNEGDHIKTPIRQVFKTLVFATQVLWTIFQSYNSSGIDRLLHGHEVRDAISYGETQSNSIDHLLKICAHRYRAVAARLTEHIAYFVQKGICSDIGKGYVKLTYTVTAARGKQLRNATIKWAYPAAIVFSKIVKVYQEILANFIVQGKDVRVKELLHKVLKKLTYVDTYARTHTNICTVQYSSESECNSV
ncbi:hypothetical protein GQX74_004069 [Glossina fuscipes]|nr:hypothetical protein GQX74_004069 [Glossina fuscipes]